MSNISDIIEQFILSNIGEDSSMDLSRNELATYFAVAPSQINYVLSTRFTVEKGYLVEGKRGGGGYIRLIRIGSTGDLLKTVYDSIGDEITERQAIHALLRLLQDGRITEREYVTLSTVLSNKGIISPIGNKDEVRAKVMKLVLERLMQYKEM